MKIELNGQIFHMAEGYFRSGNEFIQIERLKNRRNYIDKWIVHYSGPRIKGRRVGRFYFETTHLDNLTQQIKRAKLELL